MSLSQEEIKELKEQLKEQVKHLPPDKRAEAESVQFFHQHKERK